MTKKLLGIYLLRRWVDDFDECECEVKHDPEGFDCPGVDTMASYALLEDTKTKKRMLSEVPFLLEVGDFPADLKDIREYKYAALDDLFTVVNQDMQLLKDEPISRIEFDKAKVIFEDVSGVDMRAAYPTLELIENAIENGPRTWINGSWWINA